MIHLEIRKERVTRPRSTYAVRKYIYGQTKLLFQEALKQFVVTAAESMTIDTGMSTATFIDLATKLRIKGTIDAIINANMKTHKLVKEYHPVGDFQKLYKYKSKHHGRMLGRKAYKLNYGSLQRGIFRTDFSIVVYQYYLHEYQRDGDYNSKKWKSLEKGEEAFVDYIRANYTKYLDPQKVVDFIVGKVVPVTNIADVEG